MMFVDHLVFIVKDVDRTEAFYTKILGEPIRKDYDSVVYRVGDTKLFFRLPHDNKPYGVYDKDACGLNHIAFGVEDMQELEQRRELLDKAAIRHSGIRRDEKSGKDYIWLDDPDGLRVEFYLRGKNKRSTSWEESK